MKLQDLPITICFLLSLLAVLPHIIANLDSDKHALLQFAASVPHLRNLKWNSALSICNSWIGITCNKDGTRVVAIHLPGVGLSGHIPTNSIGKLDALQVLSLRANNLNGNLPSDILSIPSLYSIYLQHNNFSGDIPVSFSSTLGVVDLSFNSFTGEIPPTIKNLNRLSVLNLKFNSLSGAIPNLDASRLSFLNLSYNMLNGSIPYPLKKFPLSSFVGNYNLCGTPLSICSSSPSHKGANFKKLRNEIIIAIAIGGPSVIFLLVLFIYFCYFNKKVNDNTSMVEEKNKKLEDFGNGVQDSEKNELTFFKGCSYNFDLEDLLSASADFLGKGSYGTAYRVSLDEVTMIVVKRLKEVRVVKKEFEQHMDIVGRIRKHPNIVPFLACYYSKDEKLLVSEYIPYGSLSSALHGISYLTLLKIKTSSYNRSCLMHIMLLIVIPIPALCLHSFSLTGVT